MNASNRVRFFALYAAFASLLLPARHAVAGGLPQNRWLKQPDGYWVVLKAGDNVLDCLKALSRQEHIPSASFTAIGMVKDTTLGVFDPITKEHVPHTFADPMELGSFAGTIVWRDEHEPYVHAHAVLADSKTVAHAGHVMAATVGVTMEIYVTVKPVRLYRTIDPDLGAPVVQLP